MHLLLSLPEWEDHIRFLPDLDIAPAKAQKGRVTYTSDGIIGDFSGPPRPPPPSLVLTEEGALGISH